MFDIVDARVVYLRPRFVIENTKSLRCVRLVEQSPFLGPLRIAENHILVPCRGGGGMQPERQYMRRGQTGSHGIGKRKYSCPDDVLRTLPHFLLGEESGSRRRRELPKARGSERYEVFVWQATGRWSGSTQRNPRASDAEEGYRLPD